MNWGKGIVASFVFFALFIGVLVTVCVRQQISLVSKNYYQEELNYQQQIDQLSNTAALPVKPSVHFVRGVAVISYSDLGNIESGKLSLYRPSDPGMDHDFEVEATSDSTVRFDVSALRKGKYNVNFRWTMNGKEYLAQSTVVL